MSNKTLLIIGFVCLVLGLTPGTPIPIIFAVYLAHIGGALVILATLRFLLAPALGWPAATAVTGVLGIAQYLVIAALEPGATPFVRRMFLSWSEMVAYCGGGLLLTLLIEPVRAWQQAREKARWDAIAREDDAQWRR
jgi:hypothetical protein